jgi:D-glycero-D-manno-heptose 1,7-bisphosphate phosphatase
MFVFGHLGIGKVLSKPFSFPLWALALGCLFPDFLDKILFYGFGNVDGIISGTRTFGHSLSFAMFFILWGLLTQKHYFVAFGYGALTHIGLDNIPEWISMITSESVLIPLDFEWDSRRIQGLFWPLFGSVFPVYPYGGAGEHLSSLWDRVPTLIGECVGIFLMIWDRKAWMQLLKKRNRAIFLDRDGTINFDPGYLGDPDQLVLLDQAPEGLAKLKKMGFLLVVVTNQSGIARGFFILEKLNQIHEKMNKLLKPWNAEIDDFRFCAHLPEENCDCRKPKPKLFQDVAFDLNIDLSRSYMVGDRETDLVAGKNAGCRASLLVRTGLGTETERKNESAALYDFVGNDLKAIADWIEVQENLKT